MKLNCRQSIVTSQSPFGHDARQVDHCMHYWEGTLNNCHNFRVFARFLCSFSSNRLRCLPLMSLPCRSSLPMHQQSCYCWHCVRQLLVPVPKVPCKYANRSASLSNSNHVSNAECLNGSWTIWKCMRTWEHVQKWSLPPLTHSNHKPQTLFWPIRLCSRFNSVVII